MRLAYLDEAGISNPEHEPVMTVAGIAVHGDNQFKSVERHLDHLIEKYVPDRPTGFSFHAYQLFGGTKFYADKAKWPLEKRLEILDALIEIPRQFDLPICHCSIDRVEVAKEVAAPINSDQVEMVVHAHAYFYCAVQIEILLRASTEAEAAMLIAEDRQQTRKMLKFVHAIFRGRHKPENLDIFLKAIERPFEKIVPFERVIENIQFGQKDESSLLQIADACAFAIKRWVMRKPHADRLFAPLTDKFILGAIPVGFGPAVRSAPWTQLNSQRSAQTADRLGQPVGRVHET